MYSVGLCSFDTVLQIIWIEEDETKASRLTERLPLIWVVSPADYPPSTSTLFNLRDVPAVTNNENLRSTWRLAGNVSNPLATIVYTVNTKWLFDQMWCLGVAY